ncbi:hypothetical protein BZA77DRAFT_261930 [Pyronema omphalodes]|nr:hypothetical protein BZA77DRAFT_261930 [Pyronema omphalodes]
MKKPFTAITVHIERQTSEEYAENDVGGIPELIDVIRLQDTGPKEAARAIRKKLKYGSVHRQLRALTILDDLIRNAGPTFQRSFCDEALLDRLRCVANLNDPAIDKLVLDKARALYQQWSREYAGAPGLTGIASLWKQVPKKKTEGYKPATPLPPMVVNSKRQQAIQGPGNIFWRPKKEGSSSHQRSESTASTSSKKSVKKPKEIDLVKEKPVLDKTILDATRESTNLINALKLINREKERPSEKPSVCNIYQTCNSIRDQVDRYLQRIESNEWVGSLIHAHEELQLAIDMFETYDNGIDKDSDSDDWEKNSSDGEDAPKLPPRKGKQKEEPQEVEDDDDDDNPFADRHELLEDGMKGLVV